MAFSTHLGLVALALWSSALQNWMLTARSPIRVPTVHCGGFSGFYYM